MRFKEILFTESGRAISPDEISYKITAFGDSYSRAIKEIIDDSRILDDDGEVFIRCAARILRNFQMTRRGPFHENCYDRLCLCWDAVGINLKQINSSVLKSGLSRDRYLLELQVQERNELIAEIWQLTKKLLPFTMGKSSYGLVAASKILFSVLPEIVLPIDNAEWLHVFKTVDIGDVLHDMVLDIMRWEAITGRHLNELDSTHRLSTLPSVYNVMALEARPKDLVN